MLIGDFSGAAKAPQLNGITGEGINKHLATIALADHRYSEPLCFCRAIPFQVQHTQLEPLAESRPPSAINIDWITAFLAAGSNLFPSMMVAALGIALPDILDALSLSELQAGSLFSTTFLVATISSALAGVLADKWGRKYILVGGLGLLALGFAAAAVSSTPLAMILSLAVAGLGYGFIPASLYALMSDLLPGRRGFGASLVSVFYGTGGALGSLFASRLLSALGWRATFIATAALVAAHMLLQCWRLWNLQAKSSGRRRAALKDALSPALLTLALAEFIGGMVFWGSAAWMATLLRSAKALTINEAGWVMSTWGFSYMLGAISLGHLSDRLGRKRVILASAFPATLAGFLSFYSLESAVALACGIFIFGMFIAPAPSLVIALAQEKTAAASAGSAGGIILSAHYAAAIIAPVLTARLITGTGTLIAALTLVSTIPWLLFTCLVAGVRDRAHIA
jgi:MFS family permease